MEDPIHLYKKRDPRFADNRERAWTRHLEKELKKKLGDRKPL
jgi:hypothetical protein